MNFFEGVLSHTHGDQSNNYGHFKGEGLEIDGVRLVSTTKNTGDTVRLGIRPQHMVLDAHGPLIGTVTLVEQLGTESVLELTTDNGTPFRFASPEKVDIIAGQQACFSFNPQSAHLF